MPRNISFALTTQQFRDRTKDVTRRLGWQKLKVGELLNACEKCQGIKPGEKIVKLGQIRVKSVRREMLLACTDAEAVREGFPELTGEQFIAMFCTHMKCDPSTVVTRIEYEYIDEAVIHCCDNPACNENLVVGKEPDADGLIFCDKCEATA